MLIKQRTHFRDSRKMSGTDMSSGGSIFGSILGAVTSETAKTLGKSAVDGITKGVSEAAKKGAEEAGRRAVTSILDRATQRKTGTVTTKGTAPSATNIDERTRRLLDALKSGSGIKVIY